MEISVLKTNECKIEIWNYRYNEKTETNNRQQLTTSDAEYFEVRKTHREHDTAAALRVESLHLDSLESGDGVGQSLAKAGQRYL